MHRIDTSSRAANLFGTGKDGFKDGNALTGDPSTQLNAAWFNAVQEELCRILEAAGAALDPGDHGQIAAVLGIATRSLTHAGYQRLPGKLMLQWGAGSFTGPSDSAQDVTFPVAFPTDCLQVLVSIGSGLVSYIVGADPDGPTSFLVGIHNEDDQPAVNIGFHWLAIGY